MSGAHRVSVREYLTTAYRPDCDYVDGAIEERNLGEFDHSRTTALFCEALHAWRREADCYALISVRLRVGADRYRVPDLCIIRKEDREPVITKAPLLCIEILSPEDTQTRFVVRLDDYLAMGVPECWVIDPKLRRGSVYSRAGLIPARDGKLTLSGTDLTVDLAPLFAQL